MKKIKRTKKTKQRKVIVPPNQYNFFSENSESNFDKLPAELLQEIFKHLAIEDLIKISTVSHFWHTQAQDLCSRRINRLTPNYMQHVGSTRSSLKIYHEDFVKPAFYLIARLMSQNKLFDLVTKKKDNTETIYAHKIINQLRFLTKSIDKSINIYSLIKYLLDRTSQIPLIKSILEKGYIISEKETNSEMIKYKNNPLQTCRFNIIFFLIVLDQRETLKKTLELLQEYGIDITISYYNITPLRLAMWRNNEEAYEVLAAAGCQLYREGSVDPKYIEPTVEAAINCQAYKILPLLPNPYANNPQKKIKITLQSLKYFDDALRELYKKLPTNNGMTIFDELTEQEIIHPIAVIFQHFKCNLEETDNNEMAADVMTKNELTIEEYSIMKTIEFFCKNEWPLPEWFSIMLINLDLGLTAENKWKAEFEFEDEIQGLAALKI